MLKSSAKYLGLLLACVLLANSPNAADSIQPERPAKPDDFAYAVPVQFEGQDALYRLNLPLSVYQHCTRPDLGDLRVFNAQGEVVPHQLQAAPKSSTSEPETAELILFPLQGAAHSSLDQLSVSIKQNFNGTLINIGSQAKTATPPKLSGYLLDASAIKQPIQALELEWPQGKENFAGTVHIESSDDLQRWTTLTHKAPLASMQFAGHSLLQKRVEFASTEAKYWRLSWPQTQTPLLLTSVNATLSATQIESPLTWHASPGTAVPDKAGEYQFDLVAQLPIQRVRITLPQMNTLVQAGLYSRANPTDSWQLATNTRLYKLTHADQEINNPDLTLANNHRYWLLRVDQKSGGLGSGLPIMQAGWRAHQLHFVTRGSTPFQLAYGSIEIKPAVFQMQNLLTPATAETPELKIAEARTGTQITLGGDARLSPPPAPLPWKKWLLWSILVSAVLLLGWMAYRLMQQMK